LAETDPAEALKLLGKHAPEKTNTTDAAAWVVVARVMMNLDEFLTRE
jgi:hypothetical protein